MPEKSTPVEVPSKVTPLEPGPAVPAFDVRSGGTFAERRQAREAFDKAQAEDDAEAKQVDKAENKAVAKKQTSAK